MVGLGAEAPLGQVIGREHLEEEVGSGHGHIGHFRHRRVVEDISEDLVVDPRELEDADPGPDAGAAELVAGGQGSLLAPGEEAQEGDAVVRGDAVDTSHLPTLACRLSR